MNIGVIGYGYWGPNIVRNFQSVKNSNVLAVCDSKPEALNRARNIYPGLKLMDDPEEFIASTDIDVVAIITPVSSHYHLAKKALQNGKHIFVEKPFTQKSEEAEELIELAEKKRLTVMVDHTFIFTGAVKKIKELIDGGSLGKIYYYDSTRVNLGLFQHDVNVVWDLAPHDLSIMDYVIKEKALELAATGACHFDGRLEDIAYLTVYFENNVIAHLNVNWLSPVKIRTTLMGGDKKMLVWNDLESDEKIKIYDRGVNIGDREGIYNLLVEYRSGDMWAPRLDRKEALQSELEYFVDCIYNQKTPVNDGRAGLRIVKMLEAADISMKNRGKAVKL